MFLLNEGPDNIVFIIINSCTLCDSGLLPLSCVFVTSKWRHQTRHHSSDIDNVSPKFPKMLHLND